MPSLAPDSLAQDSRAHSASPLPADARVVVVGAGIVGLAHAYAFARRGWAVTVVERDLAAISATVRNFGMVWPIGQPLDDRRTLAMESREIWLSVARSAGLWHRECGSLHLAYHDDEAAVIQEFLAAANGDPSRAVGEWLPAEAVPAKCPAVLTGSGERGCERGGELRGALWSPWELAVDPRRTAADVAEYLHRAFGVEFRWGTSVVAVEEESDQRAIVVTATERIQARYVVVSPGSATDLGFGKMLAAQGMRRCRLQMLRAETNLTLGIHLCAGLTLLHYGSFAGLPGLAAVRDRYAAEWPGYAEEGIHLLVSQHGDGTLTIGDSHEYEATAEGPAFRPYLRESVFAKILDYLGTFLPIGEIHVTERWDGQYGKHPTEPYLSLAPDGTPGPYGPVRIIGAAGGAGMTLSFGIGEREVSKILGER